MNVVIKLTIAGTDTGPYNIYSDVDGYVSAFETNVNRSSLLAGFSSDNCPDGTNYIRVQSVGVCTNQTDIAVPGGTTTSTTTTTTTVFANLLRVTGSCCGDPTEYLVDLPQLLGYGPTATFTGIDGKPYTLVSPVMVAGTASMTQSNLDTTFYGSCAIWLTFYVSCPP